MTISRHQVAISWWLLGWYIVYEYYMRLSGTQIPFAKSLGWVVIQAVKTLAIFQYSWFQSQKKLDFCHQSMNLHILFIETICNQIFGNNGPQHSSNWAVNIGFGAFSCQLKSSYFVSLKAGLGSKYSFILIWENIFCTGT